MGATFYPLALDVLGRRCVVVGAGAVGRRKAQGFAEAGGVVTLIDPAASPSEGEDAVFATIAEPFSAEHLEGALLAVAATDQPEVNARVLEAARARGILVNLAAPAGGEAEEEIGDFVTMAAVRRGDLLIALTTGGAGPALTARLRQQLEEQFGGEWDPYVALLGRVRVWAKDHLPDPSERRVALRRLAASDAVRQRLAAGDGDGAWEEALRCIS